MSVEASGRKMKDWTAALLLSLAGSIYSAAYLRDGWFPSDEGSLAVTAERALMGGLPHRDFPDLYTGGLTWLNAGAFRILGVDLVSPRLALLAAFFVWLIVLHRLCIRFLPPWLSALVVALAVVWSVPNYPAAMPSWYNLFFATGCLLALIAYSDTGGKRWLWMAGACAGLSIAFKIIGVFLVLGAILFLLFHEQTTTGSPSDTTGRRGYSALVLLFAVSVVLVLSRLIVRVGDPAQVLRFVLPTAALVSVLVAEEWKRTGLARTSRFRTMGTSTLTFMAGMSLPLLAFALPYLASDSTGDLFAGLFTLPARRLDFAARPAPPILTYVFTVAVAGVVWLGSRVKPSLRWFHHLVFAAGGVAILVAARWYWGPYMFVFLSAYNMTPLVVVAGCAWVAFARAPEGDRRQVYGLLAVTAAIGMVEFPFSTSIYFHYAAALMILSVAALTWQIGAGRFGKVDVALPWALYLMFGLLLMNPKPPGSGGPHVAGQRWAELALPRARLRTSPADSALYGELMRIVEALGDRELGYSGPDAPEIYFLAGSRTREPILFDFLYGDGGSPVDDPGFLDGADFVVLNHEPGFSRPLRPSTLQRLAGRFPHSAFAGNFEVRWRE